VTPLARRIIRQLVRLSDAWVTSCNRYFHQLTNEFGARPAAGRIIPIGSNIPLRSMLVPKRFGDEDTTPKFRFVVFGLAKTRCWALGRHWRLLRALGQIGMIEHVTLMGQQPRPEDERTWKQLADLSGENIRWRMRFDLGAVDVSHELAAHDFGLLANEPDILTKSGVFAALAAHGVIPIVSKAGRSTLPRLFHNAALVNADTDGSIAAVVDVLRDTNALNEMREGLQALSGRELAWPRIAETWKNVIEHSAESRIVVQEEAERLPPAHRALAVASVTRL
jgi:glycosyltransferase involved in cell wall biosynthesis